MQNYKSNTRIRKIKDVMTAQRPFHVQLTEPETLLLAKYCLTYWKYVEATKTVLLMCLDDSDEQVQALHELMEKLEPIRKAITGEPSKGYKVIRFVDATSEDKGV